MNKFNLTFTEAMQVLADNNGWVQGEGFHSQVVLINEFDTIKARDFRSASPHNTPLTVGMMKQKYRVVQFQSELEKQSC